MKTILSADYFYLPPISIDNFIDNNIVIYVT